MSAWVKHVTATYNEMKKKNKDAKLGDAMKAAKKTYKKPNGTRKSGGGRLDAAMNRPSTGTKIKLGSFGKCYKYKGMTSDNKVIYENEDRVDVTDPNNVGEWHTCGLQGGKKSRRRSNRRRTARKSSRKNRRTRRR